MSHDSQSPVESGTPDAPAKTPWKPLRFWPPVLLLAGMVFFRFLPHLLEDAPPSIWMSATFGPVLCCLFILIWWLTFSRATRSERIAGFFGIVLAVGITMACLDKSMIGPGFVVLTIPMGFAAFAVGAILCSRILSFRRTAIALFLACLGFGFSTLVRTDGMWGNFALGVHWRWTPSQEEVLVHNAGSRGKADLKIPNIADVAPETEWPAFRGPNRDGRQHGPKISSDWKTAPPKLIWKISVGPGWSSFVAAGNWIFTQEQRGASETVVCYEADTGLEVWTQQVESRFDDPLGGPGPRATPTIAQGSLFATFATGIVMRLDPATGQVVWQQDLRKVADRSPPAWGFSSSPLVVDSVVIVHAGGAGDKGIFGFDVETGKLKWSTRARGPLVWLAAVVNDSR